MHVLFAKGPTVDSTEITISKIGQYDGMLSLLDAGRNRGTAHFGILRPASSSPDFGVAKPKFAPPSYSSDNAGLNQT
uniref:Uncharacterized protein n=1 Tax=Chromera velia CCMP2878 TaxID=1169474 RepID=A0A0G4HZV8_9ALVE|eukprot:Cvel_9796.t1-p1 / transcript=Cvel_9796.t1 / gene=Cvel_9796 / organism=Chromera_velia_CCMP2878 / gene_product=hypothetical protein / transcript_product=hypothetical protein / location=Cvel_scaffold575:7803-12403(+) / protein_length=76 / sequence_SO=supercontig / SO=protein_coding / is_pseudo=false